MREISNIVLYVILLCCSKISLGLEHAKQQRYNPNTDFLIHEAGGNAAAPKRDYVSPQPTKLPTGSTLNSGKQDYFSQFPSLGTSFSPNSLTTVKPNLVSATPKSQTTSGKRDYVAPGFPSLKPPQGNSGKVKDLVNIYDNPNPNTPQKPPSYSSILQGTNQHGSLSGTTAHAQPVTPSTQKVPTSPGAKKPLSFSNVVAGSNPNLPTLSTPKQESTRVPSSTPIKPNRPGTGFSSSPTHRPATPVLPSSILSNNRNNNQANNANSPTDTELQTLSEELLRKDNNNAAKYITINYQQKTTSYSSEDKAPLPLLTISADVWNIPTVQKFVPLLDNYERDTLVNEYVTPQERNEENAFMDAVMSTNVIRHLMNFLKDKGYVTPDPRQQRDFLKQLWFSLYSRGKGKISSSGFEHVFVSELRNSDVLGLHNWIYFAKEESANRANYLGYLKYEQLNDKGVVMKLHFNQQGVDKPVDSMFIGTSPELEIALYTLCFVTRAGNDCKLKLGNKDVNILTHTFRYRSKNLIGSAYPQI